MIDIKKIFTCVTFFLFLDLAVQAQSLDTIGKKISLDEVKITSKKTPKLFLFSSFEKKVHISLNPHHDEYRYSFINKQPDEFVAASFLHNDTTSIYVQKIEGRLPPFDTNIVRVSVVIIQYNKTLATINLPLEKIKKNQFTLYVDNLHIGTGEFYVLYFCKFLKQGEFHVVVSPKKESKRFSFKNSQVGKGDNFFLKFKFPAPQFKVYCYEM